MNQGKGKKREEKTRKGKEKGKRKRQEREKKKIRKKNLDFIPSNQNTLFIITHLNVTCCIQPIVNIITKNNFKLEREGKGERKVNIFKLCLNLRGREREEIVPG